MAVPEHLKEFERRVAARLADAVDEMRRSLHAQAERASSQLLTDIESFRPELPQRLLGDAELAGLDRPAPDETRGELGRELVRALAALDAATTQSAALETLLAAARSRGGRSALWLTHEDALVGWGSAGFTHNGEADPVEGRRLAYDRSPALARLARGRGVVRLEGVDAARFAAELDVPAPHAAALVPLVLRDRLAAALYVDSASGEVELERTQLLTHATAQRLELQGLSVRSYTPTLVLDEEAPAGSAGLPLWNADEVAALGGALPAAAVAAEDSTEAPTARFEHSPLAESVSDFKIVDEPSDFTLDVAPEAAEPSAASDFVLESETLSEPMPTVTSGLPEPEAPFELPEPEATPLELAEVEPPPPIGAAADVGWEMDETTPPMPATTAVEGERETGRIPFAEVVESSSVEFVREIGLDSPVIEATAEFMPPPSPASLAPPPSPQATQAIRTGGIGTHEFPLPAVRAEETTADLTEDATLLLRKSAPPLAPPTWPALAPLQGAMAGDSTVAIPRLGRPTPDSAYLAPAAAPPAPAPVPTELPAVPPVDDEPTIAKARTTEVIAPADVQGPGWAFTSSRTPRASGENALHEEARRLARLLISEIKLYNEEQVEEGRRNRDVYHRLKEDIDRSRQIYEERVHESVRTSTDYFQQELVRSLAGGDARALGI